MQKHVNLVDLVKSFLTSIYYLFAKLGFDTAENEPEYEYGISLIFVSLMFGPDVVLHMVTNLEPRFCEARVSCLLCTHKKKISAPTPAKTQPLNVPARSAEERHTQREAN